MDFTQPGNFQMIGDDLVNSYHLLLCCLDLVFGNAMLCSNRKDLINPLFKGRSICLDMINSIGELTDFPPSCPYSSSCAPITVPWVWRFSQTIMLCFICCRSGDSRAAQRLARCDSLCRGAPLCDRQAVWSAWRPGGGGQRHQGALLQTLHQAALREKG